MPERLVRTVRPIAVAAAFAGSLVAPQIGLAQDWPAKPVTIIVPFVAGGTTDIAARLREIGAEPGGEALAQFASFIRAETEKWTRLSKEAGIQAD